MMARRVVTSEEVYSNEGSIEEPVDVDQNESQLRFQENVVFVPYVLPPVMVMEYTPTIFNYQTYEPHLINRYEVSYVPTIRQVSYIQYVPYYSNFYAPEVISNSVQYEDDPLSNRYPSSDLDDTHISEISEFSFASEDNDLLHTESSPEEISEPNVFSEENLVQVPIDGDSGIDDVNKNDSSCIDVENRVIDADSSHLSRLDVSETVTNVLNPINEDNASFHDVKSKKEKDNYQNDDEDRCMEAGDSRLSWFDVTKKSDVVHPTDENQAFVYDDNDKNDNDSYYNDDEDHGVQVSNLDLSCFDVTEKFHVVNPTEENKASLDEVSGEKENERSHNDEEDRSMHADNSNSFCFDVTEKLHVVNPIEENEVSFDDSRDKMENESSQNEDEEDGPIITLADILASEEYWKVKRDEYWHKRRSTHLYRSALERDIRPQKPLPDVGTLPTIFEDLPYPVNEPYDAGEDTYIAEYFDLKPLEVKKSESSSVALVPKKKKFRNTRKLFSRLFRCFKPKTVEGNKPP